MSSTLPWKQGSKPLMLAPMQGLTNRALRSIFIEWAEPDIVFTEFVRVRPAGSRHAISKVDQLEIACTDKNTPLIVQLIGNSAESLSAAAISAREAGAKHLNINLGCPYGRMSAGSAGGALLKDPTGLSEKLLAVKEQSTGSFSVKVRSGYDDPKQIFTLLQMFEECKVDFLILHPRTVQQKFSGSADHKITSELVRQTDLPVIANGDVITAEDGQKILNQTGADGLMLGRGAVRDPLLFKRLKGKASEKPSEQERISESKYYLHELVTRYRDIFEGDIQVLNKVKTVVNMMKEDEHLAKKAKKLLRTKKLETFIDQLNSFV